MKVCHCGPRFSYDQAKQVPAPFEWPTTRFAWLCLTCNGINHAVQEPVPMIRGPKNARALLHANVKANGQHELAWAVGDQEGKAREKIKTVEFFPWPRRHPMSEAEPLIFKSWELLMSKMPLVMEKVDEWDPQEVDRRREQQQAKYAARGIAEVLAILLKPFMESADHVVKCAVKAYKDPDFEVPGLGAHLWDPLRNPDGTSRVAMTAPKSSPARKAAPKKAAPKNTLSANDILGIREALSSGLFTPEDIAGMYKVSVSQVKEVTT